MAELLITKEILVALDNIIRKAEKYICIFTYNVKIDENYLTRLRNAGKRGVAITIVFGVDNGKKETINSILEIPNCKLYFKEYMHAKFFYNEKELLVGSMNLSEASAKNNFEMATLYNGTEYNSVIKKVKEEAREIIEDSIPWKDVSKRISHSFKYEAKTNSVEKKHDEGYCIRCASYIPLNIDRPLCYGCYQEWAEWENEYYQEGYDHCTGEQSNGSTSYASPVMNKNWKKFQSKKV